MNRIERIMKNKEERNQALKGIFLNDYSIGEDFGELGFQLMVDTDTIDSTSLKLLQKSFNINTMKVNLRNGTLDFYLNGPLQ